MCPDGASEATDSGNWKACEEKPSERKASWLYFEYIKEVPYLYYDVGWVCSSIYFLPQPTPSFSRLESGNFYLLLDGRLE